MPSDPPLAFMAEALVEENHIQGVNLCGPLHDPQRREVLGGAGDLARGRDGRRRAGPHGAADRGRATEARVRRRLTAHRRPVPGTEANEARAALDLPEGHLTVFIHGAAGAVGLRLSVEGTRAFCRRMGQHLKPGRFDSRG